MNKKRILVTGGLGNLGSWIIDTAMNDYDVTVLSKSHRNLKIQKGYELLIADLSDAKGLSEVIGDKTFHYVIHAGSVNDGFVDNYDSLSYRVNAFGTKNLIKALNFNVLEHFIYMSTFQVYGIQGGDVTENTLVAPKNDYALSHLMGEYFVSMLMPKNSYSVIRLTNSYGCPKDFDSSKWYLILNDLSKSAFDKKEIIMTSNGKAIRDFIWMDDVVKVLLSLLDSRPDNDIYNLSSGIATSLFEVATAVQDAYQHYCGICLPIVTRIDDTNSYEQSLHVSSEKIKEKVHFTPKDRMLEESLKIFELIESANSEIEK